MRILICDDDQLFNSQLEKLLNQYFSKMHVYPPELLTFTNGPDLLADNGDKDIVFLDMEMPGMNGIYIGKELKKQNRNTLIFVVTSYAEYLDEAMRFHVFRYLSKPLDRQRLFRNLSDALTVYHNQSMKIPIEMKTGVQTVPTSHIISVEAQLRKIIVHTFNCDFESIHNMNYWLKLLPAGCFFQSHRSFIINLEHVTDFDHSMISLANGSFHAYLTRRKYKAFKDAYLLYLESTR